MNDQFYVGYLPKAPAGSGKILARITAGIVLAGLVVSAVLILGQPQFAASKFEYGEYRDYAGVIEEWPYPMLVTDNASFLLVAPGKRGLSDAVKGLQGKRVRLKGSLIERAPDRMIEVLPASIKAGSQQPQADSQRTYRLRSGHAARRDRRHEVLSGSDESRRAQSAPRLRCSLRQWRRTSGATCAGRFWGQQDSASSRRRRPGSQQGGFAICGRAFGDFGRPGTNRVDADAKSQSSPIPAHHGIESGTARI